MLVDFGVIWDGGVVGHSSEEADCANGGHVLRCDAYDEAKLMLNIMGFVSHWVVDAVHFIVLQASHALPY